MRQHRLYWLLALLLVVAGVRIFVPSRAEADVTGSAAVVSATPVALATVARVPPVAAPMQIQRTEVAPQEAPAEPDAAAEPGNAFAVRTKVQPPPAPVVKVVVAPPAPSSPIVNVVPPPPPPPPPLRVIGTWDDGKAPGVFVVAPHGTVLARAGTVLMAEYRVTQVTAHQVSLLHIASKRELSIPVPRVATPQ